MAKGYFKAQLETNQPGNELNSTTLSTKTLYVPALSVSPKLNADPMERDDEIRNLDEPIPVISEQYNPGWEAETRMYPDLLGFLLTAMLGPPTSTAGGATTDPDGTTIPAGATKHVFTAPFLPSGASPQTFEGIFAYADQGVFFKQRGCGVEAFAIDTPESGGARIKANGPALYMNRISDPSLSPTYESLSVRPFTRGDLTLDWLASGGVVEDFNLSIANPIDVVRSLGIKSKFPDVMEKGDGLVIATGSIPKRILNTLDWDALVNATGFSAKARWVSDTIIASSYPYKLFVEFDNAQYVSGDPDDLSNKRRHGATFNFRSSRSSGASLKITVVNATASYS